MNNLTTPRSGVERLKGGPERTRGKAQRRVVEASPTCDTLMSVEERPALRSKQLPQSSAASKRLLLSVIALGLFIFCIAQLPSIFIPKRWLDIRAGQTREQVVSAIGRPDADYFAAKSFDGWHNHFYIGASVLRINYRQDSDIVASKEIQTHWGLAYRGWIRHYLQGASPR